MTLGKNYKKFNNELMVNKMKNHKSDSNKEDEAKSEIFVVFTIPTKLC